MINRRFAQLQPFVAGVATPSRYRRARHVRRSGIEYVLSPPRLNLAPKLDDIQHTWGDGEWLDMLAYRYYGDATLWWVIADYNSIDDVRVIDVGSKLRLPSLRRLHLEIIPLVT